MIGFIEIFTDSGIVTTLPTDLPPLDAGRMVDEQVERQGDGYGWRYVETDTGHVLAEIRN